MLQWVFSNESVLRIRWPEYWNFSFIFSPSNEYSGLSSFKIDWFDLLAVQGILKSLLQYYSLKTSILQCSAFFTVQLSHLCVITGKYPDAGKDRGQEEKGAAEDEMVGWHHQLNGHQFEQTPGDGERQGSLACCSPQGCNESVMTERLNSDNTSLITA